MITPKTLKINVEADDPSEALVVDYSNLRGKSIGTIVSGDLLEYVIIPVDTVGTSSIAGSNTVKCQLAIGRYDVGLMASSSFLYASASYGWTGSINTNNNVFLNAVNATGEATFDANFEVEFTRTSGSVSGSKITILQSPITIRRQILS